MITTADRRAADHLRADAYLLEAVAAEMFSRASEICGDTFRAALSRQAAQAFRESSASKRQDAEQVPHHSEVE